MTQQRFFLAIMLTLVCLGIPAFAQNTYTWTGAGGNNNWSDPANWSESATTPENNFPNATFHSVVISDPMATVIMDAGVPMSVTLANFYVDAGSLDTNGREINTGGVDTVDLDGVVIFNGGSYQTTVRGVTGLTVDPGGEAIFSGTMVGRDITLNGDMVNEAVVRAQLNTSFGSTVDVPINSRLIIDGNGGGSANVDIGSFFSMSGGTLDLASSTPGHDAILNVGGGTGTIAGSGTLVTTGSEAGRVINGNFNMAGSHSIAVSLVINAPGTQAWDGFWALTGNGMDVTFDLQGTGTFAPPVTSGVDVQNDNAFIVRNGGDVDMSNVTFSSTVRGPAARVELNGVDIINSLSVDIDTTLVNCNLTSSGFITNNNVLRIQGAVNIDAMAGLDNTSGTLRVEGSGAVGNLIFATSTNLNGTVELQSLDGNTAQISVPGVLTNSGTLNAVAPASSPGPLQIIGTLNNASGGIINVNHQLDLPSANAAHQNQGTININAGVFQVTQSGTPASFFNTDTGTINIDGTTGTATFLLDGGSFIQNGVNADGLVDPSGTMIPANPHVRFENVTMAAASIENTLLFYYVGGVIDGDSQFDNRNFLKILDTVTSNGNVVNTTSTPEIRILSAGGGLSEFVNNGLFDNNGGAISLDSQSAPGRGGATATFTDTTGAFTNPAGGTIISLPGNGGDRRFNAELTNNGTLQLDYELTFPTNGGTHVNNGTIDINGGFLLLPNLGMGQTFTNNNTIDIDTSGGFQIDGGTYIAAGTVTSTVPTPPIRRGGASRVPIASEDGMVFINTDIQGTLNNTGVAYLINSSISGTVDNDAGGALFARGTNTITGNLFNRMSGGLVVVQGDAVYGEGQLNYSGVMGANEGDMRLDSDDSLSGASINGTMTFINSGNFISQGSIGPNRVINIPFFNDGSLRADYGLEFQGAFAYENATLGNITAGSGDLFMNNTGGTFTNSGSLVINSGRSVNMNNINFNPSNGSISDVRGPGGSGNLGLLNVVFTGPGSLITGSSIATTMQGCTGNVAIQNNGTFEVYGTNSLNGSVDNNGTWTLWGDNIQGNASLSVSGNFNNVGTFDFNTNTVAHNATLTAGSFISPSGSLVQTPAPATVPHELLAPVNLGGTFNVSNSLTITASDVVHFIGSSGDLNVGSGATLLVNDPSAQAPTGGLGVTGLLTVDGTLNMLNARVTTQNIGGVTFGKLMGSGTVSGDVVNDGIINAGSSPGQLSIIGNVNFMADGIFEVEIQGFVPGASYDVLNVTGNINQAGELAVILNGGFDPGLGDTFTVLNFTGTSSGFFSTLSGILTPSGAELVPNETANSVQLVTQPGQITWTGAVNNDWDTPGNWDAGAVPGPNSNAVIDLPGAVVFSSTVDVANLTLGGPSGNQTLNHAGGNLTANSVDVLLNGILNMDNGSIVFPCVKCRGGSTGFTVNGEANFSGFCSVDLDIANSGIMTLSATTMGQPGFLDVFGFFDNDGIFEMDSTVNESVSMTVSFSLNNGSTGSVQVKAGAGGNRQINGRIDNDGLFSVDTALDLDPSGLGSTLNAGTTLFLSEDSNTLARYSFDEEEGPIVDQTEGGRNLMQADIQRVAGAVGQAVLLNTELDQGLDLTILEDLLAEQKEWTLEYLTAAGDEAGTPVTVVFSDVNLNQTRVTEDNKWHYHAITWDGQSLRTYRDGELLEERQDIIMPTPDTTLAPRLVIDSNSNTAIVAMVDELKLSKGVLDADRIARNWHSLEKLNPRVLPEDVTGDTLERVIADGRTVRLVNLREDSLVLRGDRDMERPKTLHYTTFDGQPGILTNFNATQLDNGDWRIEGGERVSRGIGGFFNNLTLALNNGSIDMISGPFDNTLSGSIIGSGSINVSSLGTTFNNGFIVPGLPDFGVIDFIGDMTFDSGSLLVLELGGTTPGVNHDLVTVSGNAAFGGDISTPLFGSFTGMDGDVLSVFTYASQTGSFNSQLLPTPANGLEYIGSVQPTSFDVSIQAIGPISGVQIFAMDLSNNQSFGIDAQTGALNAAVNVGSAPANPDASFDGSRIYIPNSGDGTITVIDAFTKQVVDTYTGFNSPSELGVTPDNTALWVADTSAIRGVPPEVQVVDTSTGSIIDTLTGGCLNLPLGISAILHNRFDNVSYVILGNGTVCIYDTATRVFQTSFVTGIFISDAVLTADATEIIFAAGADAGRINTSTGNVTNFTSVTGFVTGIDVTNDGQFAVLANGGDTAQIFNVMTGTPVNSVTFSGSPVLSDVTIIDSLDKIWFTNSGGSDLYFSSLSSPSANPPVVFTGSGFERLIDNEQAIGFPGTFEFDMVSYTVREDGGMVTIGINRVGGSDGSITVSVIPSDDSAQAPGDYDDSIIDVTFQDGETFQSVDILINDDRIEEGNEDFTIDLFPFIGKFQRGQLFDSATVTIEDWEEGTFSFVNVTINTDETVGLLTIDVARQGGSDGDALVDANITGGTATNGQDYDFFGKTLNFNDGQVLNSFDIQIFDDLEEEDLETLLIALQNPTNNSQVSNTAGNLTINIDDFEEGFAEFLQPVYQVGEGDGTANINLTRVGGSDGPLTVFFTAIDGTATNGQDYNSISVPITFNDGETSAIAQVTILEDSELEGVETVLLELGRGNPERGSTIPGAILEIIDNETEPVPGEVRFTSSAYSGNEGSGIEVTVERVNGTDGAIFVDLFTTPGTADPESDYVPEFVTLTFPDGSATPQTVTIATLDDEDFEGNETFTVSLGQSDARSIGTPSTAVVTIIDDEIPPAPGVFALSSNAFTIDEDRLEVFIGVTRTEGEEGEVTVGLNLTNGSAVAGQDFVPEPMTLTFANGESGTRLIPIQLIDDQTSELDEIFTANLVILDGVGEIGDPAQAQVTIRDDDRQTVSWEISELSVNESDTTVSVDALLDGVLPTSVTVDVAIGGSASGADYSAPITLSFPAGTTRATFQIDVIGDDMVEPDETVAVQLLAGSVDVGTPDTFTLTIENDDAVEVNWVESGIGVREGGQAKADTTVSLLAFLNTAVNEEQSIPFQVGGTAGALDHDLVSGNLVFPAGETSAQLDFTLFDDTLAGEGVETILIRLLGNNDVMAGNNADATVRVRDNDVARVSWLENAASIEENDASGSAQATLQLSNPLTGDLTIDFNVGGNASFGSDHTLAPGSITFPAGSTANQSITIPIVDDSQLEFNELVVVDLIPPAGLPPFLRFAGNRQFRLQILDDDNLSAPDTEILTPVSGSEFRVGTVVTHTAQGIPAEGEPFSYVHELCTSDGLDCTQYTDQSFDLTYNQPGVYILTSRAIDANGSADPTPAVSRFRIVPNRPPLVRITSPALPVLDVPVGSNVSFSAEASDPDGIGKAIDSIVWTLQGQDGTLAAGPVLEDFDFNLAGGFNVVVTATDSEGASSSDNIRVNVFEDMPPLRAAIVMPERGSTFNVGDPVQMMGEIINDTTGKRARVTNWDYGNGSAGTGLTPTHTYSEPGQYLIRFLVTDDETGERFTARTTINVRSQEPPLVDFGFPTDLVLNPANLSKNGFVDAYFNALVLDTQGNEDLSFYWEFNTGEGTESQRFHETPGRFPFTEEGTYTVSLFAVTSDGVQSNTAVRTITVRNFQDEDFEPNDTADDAPVITPGNYEALALDGDPDFYKVDVPADGQRLILKTQSDGPLKINVQNPEGETIITDRIIQAEGNIQLPALPAGTYCIKIEAAEPGKTGLSFNFGVTVLNPALYFPEMRIDQGFDSQLGVVNQTGENASLEAIGYDAEGNIVAEVPFELMPRGRAHFTSEDLFGDDANEVAWVQVDSTHNITGYTRTEGRDSEEVYAVSGNNKLSSEVYVPHIAALTNQWFTRASVINGSDLSVAAKIDTPDQDGDLTLNKGFAQDSFEFIDRFGGTLNEDSEWAVFEEQNNDANLAGVEVFGTFDGSRVAAGLALADARKDNPNFTFIANNLYFTHIASNQDFYTGIALVNIGNFEQGIVITAFGPGGTLVGSKERTMAPFQKIVEVADVFLEGLGDSQSVDWVLVEADEDVVGFELFGTFNTETLAGLEASTALSTELCYPFIDENLAVGHGISVLNVGEQPNNVELSLYNNQGEVVATYTTQLMPFQKLTNTLTGFFGVLDDDVIPGWLGVKAEEPIAGFELFINPGGQQMGALLAQ